MKSNDSFVHNLRSDFHMTQRTLTPVRFSDGLTGPSIGGFSGAPVFLLPQPFFTEGKFSIPGSNNPAICVGLVHGTLSDSTGGKTRRSGSRQHYCRNS